MISSRGARAVARLRGGSLACTARVCCYLMRVCVYACMCVCVYACMHTYMYVDVDVDAAMAQPCCKPQNSCGVPGAERKQCAQDKSSLGASAITQDPGLKMFAWS